MVGHDPSLCFAETIKMAKLNSETRIHDEFTFVWGLGGNKKHKHLEKKVIIKAALNRKKDNDKSVNRTNVFFVKTKTNLVKYDFFLKIFPKNTRSNDLRTFKIHF